MTARDVKDLYEDLEETLNPEMPRGVVDHFLIRKQKDEVRKHLLRFSSNKKNSDVAHVCCIINMWMFFLLGLWCSGHSLH